MVQTFRYTGIHSLGGTERKVKYWACCGDGSSEKESGDEAWDFVH